MTSITLVPFEMTEDLIMEHIPWFAWIAVVGIMVWGVVAAVGSITGRPHQSRPRDCEHEDVEQLKRRIEQLEAQLYRRS